MVFLKDIVCILFDLLKRIFALAFLIPFIFILIICALISHLIDKYSYKEEFVFCKYLNTFLYNLFYKGFKKYAK